MSRATLSPPWTTYQQTIHLFTQCPRSRLLSQPWSPSFTNNHTAPRPGIYTLRSRNHTTAVISGYRQPLKQQDTTRNQARHASSSSSSRWKTRQSNDGFARGAKVAGLKSRAAFKLLELDGKHRLFRAGNTVVDLGYAPGSWSQVAVNRTSPGGRVVGIDVIPAQPPRGASSIQGNFLSAEVREEVRRYVKDSNRGRARVRGLMGRKEMEDGGNGVSESEMVDMERGIVDLGIHADEHDADAVTNETAEKRKSLTRIELDEAEGHVVDVVLSDMSAPWEQTTGMWIKSVSNPYFRMMNTSGMPFRDHAGSMVRLDSSTIFT